MDTLGEMTDGSKPERQARGILSSRLSETLPIPISDNWDEHLWEVRLIERLILGLVTGGDCQVGYIIQLEEIGWKEVGVRLLKERKISISSCV